MPSKKLDDEERALFRQNMRDVRPYCRPEPLALKKSPAPFLSAMVLSDNTTMPEVVSEVPERHCRGKYPPSPGVTRCRLLKRLANGQRQPEGQLDLHGKTLLEAERAVNCFLVDSWRDHVKCVLIICGKGYSSSNGKAVLRPALEGWLKVHPLVSDYEISAPRDGGSGAFYVFF